MSNEFSFNVERHAGRHVSLKSEKSILRPEDIEDSRFVWTSKNVEEYRMNLENGIVKPGPSPFHEKNSLLRKADITFEYTQEELDEIRKCQKDPLHFADKYAFSMTDEGIQKIVLRDYQREIIQGYKDNRFCVLLSSRQSGKCVSPLVSLEVEDDWGKFNVKGYDLWFLYQLIPLKLYILYFLIDSGLTFLWRMVEKIEASQYKNRSLDANDPRKKILSQKKVRNIKIKTDTGYHPIKNLILTQPYTFYRITTDVETLEAADNHIVYEYGTSDEVMVKNLTIGDSILTELGRGEITNIQVLTRKNCMFDLEVDSKDHRYYTNKILSHNTVTSSIFLAWYFCFNFDKNLVVVANKGTTTTEIVDKIKNVYYNLPFFLKPGIFVNNQHQLKFDNGCRLFGFTTSKTPALGFTVHFLYADEFAHIPASIIEPFWQAIFPTMSASQISRSIITSTANGINKFFYLYQGALKKENSFFPLRVDWWQVPGRNEEWKEKQIADIGSEESFNQEYGNQFISSSNMVLEEEQVRKMNRMKTPFVHRTIDLLDEKMLDYRCLTWHPKFDIEEIFDSNHKFVLSIDTSEGNGNDYIVMNIQKICPLSKVRLKKLKTFNDETDFFGLTQVGIFRSNRYPLEMFADFLPVLVHEVFNPENIHIIIEMNYRGDLIVERLKKHPKFFIEMLVHSYQQENHVIKKPGVKTIQKNKPTLIGGLRNQIIKNRLIYTEINTVLEISNFGIDDKHGPDRIKFISQTGNDDIILTSVFSGFYLGTPEFQEFISQIFDDYPQIHKIIYGKLDMVSEDNDDIKYLHELQ